MQSDVIHHFHDLAVGGAVPGTFQRGEGSSYRRVCIRTGGGYHVIRESGVVSAAVVGVKNQRGV